MKTTSPYSLCLLLLGSACVEDKTTLVENAAEDVEAVEVSVSVDLDEHLAKMQTYALGLHSSVYDNALHHPRVPGLLNEAGIAMLRYPGGGYSDNYHWSNHSMTPWPPEEDDQEENRGWLAERSDFGSYWSLIEAFGGGLMITVNYGSNLQGDGPGEPKEAAAWVAYANGDPDDTTSIGEDGAGNDWRTVGYWASLRAAEPLEEDDGLNFLRISRSDPMRITYWEIGNELFGNGYYQGEFELDLHVPYDGTQRLGHPDLSPSTYGRGVTQYVAEMKRVDPDIKVGAVLVTPPDDYAWAPEWNDDVLAECASVIDFGIIHWYPADSLSSLLQAPRQSVKSMFELLREDLERHAGERAADIEIAVTELGPNQAVPPGIQQEKGLFAADAYASMIAEGASNIAWLELHKAHFLNERTQAKGPAFHAIKMVHLLSQPGDTFVATASSRASLRSHAAHRADGSLGLMLINTERQFAAEVSVEVLGDRFSEDGQIYEFGPEDQGDTGGVSGPRDDDDVGNDFSIIVPPSTVLNVLLEAEADR